MVLRLNPNGRGIKRLQTRAEALMISEADRRGSLLRQLDQEHIRQVRRAFATEGASFGEVWPRWSPNYARWRRRHGRRLGLKMLRLSDTMYEAFIFPSHGNHVRAWLGSFRFAFGARSEVAFWHEHGEGNLPVRSVIRKTRGDLRNFLAVLLRFWRAKVRQAIR